MPTATFSMGILLAGLCFAGCAGKTDDPASTSPDAAAADVGAEAASSPCNDLVNVADPIQPTSVAESAPTPKGGTIVDGTYVMTASVEYTGPGGTSGNRGALLKGTVAITGPTMQVIQQLGTGKPAIATATLTTAGTKITVAYTCPSAFVATFDGYEATATTLQLHDTANRIVLSLNRR